MAEETNIINETKLGNQILEHRLRPQLLFIRVMLSLLYISILYSYYKDVSLNCWLRSHFQYYTRREVKIEKEQKDPRW
jgi:hypothetical protein